MELHAPPPLKIAVVGQGAIGSLLAYQCHKEKINFHLLLRSSTDTEIQVQEYSGHFSRLNCDYQLINQPLDCDLIFIPAKAYQVKDVLLALKPHLNSQQTIVLLHNGMGTIETAQQLLPHNPCIAATTSYGAYKPDANHLKITGLGETHLGWVSQNMPAKRLQIENTLSTILPPSKWHQDIQLALWKKLTINAAINPLTAIHNIKNGQLIEQKYRPTIHLICQELAAVMQAMGYKVTPERLLVEVETVIQKTALNYSSMHQDIQSKRLTEIDFINGYVVKKAQELNINVPENLKLVQSIKTLEQQGNA